MAIPRGFRHGVDAVEDVDLGFEKVVQAIQDLQVGVVVGILQDRGGEVAEGGELTLAGYAAVNEFGTKDGHVPERSFLRSTVAENEGRYVRELVDAARSVMVGDAEIEAAFGMVGLGAENDVKDKIRDLRDPPNAASTLRRKYPGDNPLIDTGRMRQAISHAVLDLAEAEREGE